MNEDMEEIKRCVKSYPDWPKPGILFRDIFPIFQNPTLLGKLMDQMENVIRTNAPDVEAIVGLDSRGFLFGPTLALRLNVAFIPIRKKGKLPGKVCSQSYSLEYGIDTLEVQVDSIPADLKVVVVDDLLATGGTMSASMQLLKTCKAEVLCGLVVMELSDLKARDKINDKLYSLITY